MYEIIYLQQQIIRIHKYFEPPQSFLKEKADIAFE